MEAEEGGQLLQFDANFLKGRSSSSELTKKLKTLHEELASHEQGELERDSIKAVAKELVSNALLLHKDRSVKAYVACCLADVLKLMAPDAPYTQNQLKDVFAFIFRQLKILGKTSGDNVHQAQYAYLLNSLSSAKSACLVCELSNADEQMSEAFRDFFDVIGSDTPDHVRQFMADILSQLIDESQSIPLDVIDILLAQFLPKLAKQQPPSYLLARAVCQASSDRLQRYISQYFTDIFTSAADQLKVDDEPDLHGLERAHGIILELNRVAPTILLNVIPQLEEELQTDQLQLRLLATKTLGSMFTVGHGQIDHLAKRFPAAWKAWLGRSRDKSVFVRLALLEKLGAIWTAHADLANDVQAVLKAKLLDPDDKVRLATCAIFSNCDVETAIHHGDLSLFKTLAERIQDKKPTVAGEALRAISRFYNLTFQEIVSQEPDVEALFGWIPEDVIGRYYTTDGHLRCQIEAAVLEHLFPLPSRAEDASNWFDRFLYIAGSLSTKSRGLLYRIAHLGARRAYEKYIQVCEKYNGGIMDGGHDEMTKQLETLCAFMASAFPEPKRAQDDLIKFAKMNDNRIYKLLKTLMDPQTDLQTLLKTRTECERRIEQSASSLSDTFTTFIRHSSFLLINREFVPHLLSKLQSADQDDETALLCESVIQLIAKQCPAMFKGYMTNLVRALSVDEHNDRLILSSLFCLKEVGKWDASVLAFSEPFVERINHIAMYGFNKQSNYAGKVASFNPDKKAVINLAVDLVDALPSSSGARLAAQLGALNGICKFCVDALSEREDALRDYICNHVLAGKTGHVDLEDEDDWIEEDDVPDDSLALVMSLKTLVNLEMGRFKASSVKNLHSLDSTFALLRGLLDPEASSKKYGKSDASRLRLEAAVSLLKFGCIKEAEPAVFSVFQPLALRVQDHCFLVRHRLLQKLCRYLSDRKLTHANFNIMLFCVAHDPEEENIQLVKVNIVGRLQRLTGDLRLDMFEKPFPRLLHFIAHHPDFGPEEDDVLQTAKYLDFYFDCVLNRENASFIYYLASRLHTVRDASSSGHTENLYIIADLAKHMIYTRATEMGWILSRYQGSVKMPLDIFRPLPDAKTVQKIATTRWVKPVILEQVDAVFKKTKSEPQHVRKRKAPAATTAKNSSAKKADMQSDDALSKTESVHSDDSNDDEAQPKKRSRGETKRPKAKPTVDHPLRRSGRETKARTAVKDMSEDEAEQELEDMQ